MPHKKKKEKKEKYPVDETNLAQSVPKEMTQKDDEVMPVGFGNEWRKFTSCDSATGSATVAAQRIECCMIENEFEDLACSECLYHLKPLCKCNEMIHNPTNTHLTCIKLKIFPFLQSAPNIHSVANCPFPGNNFAGWNINNKEVIDSCVLFSLILHCVHLLHYCTFTSKTLPVKLSVKSSLCCLHVGGECKTEAHKGSYDRGKNLRVDRKVLLWCAMSNIYI